MSEGKNTSFVFYRSFYEACQELKPVDQAAVYNATCELALNGEVTTNLTGIPKAIFTLIRPQIEANRKRMVSGKKGGRPRNQKPSDTNIETDGFENNDNKKTNGFENENQWLSDDDAHNTQKNNLMRNAECVMRNAECVMRNAGEKKEKESQETHTHAFGEFENVFLSEDQLTAFQQKYPDWKSKIDRLSTYMQSAGKQYRDHYATLLLWADQDARKKPSGTSDRSDWYSDMGDQSPTDAKLLDEIAQIRREQREKGG